MNETRLQRRFAGFEAGRIAKLNLDVEEDLLNLGLDFD